MSQATGQVSIRMMSGEADIEATWPLFSSFHKETRYRNLEAIRERRSAYLRDNMLNKPDKFGTIIADYGSEPAGFLSCDANRLLYCDEVVASCMALYVLPNFRASLLGGRIATKLLDAYRRWASNRGAVEMQVHVTSGVGIARTDKFLRRIGFRQVGGNYSLILERRWSRGFWLWSGHVMLSCALLLGGS